MHAHCTNEESQFELLGTLAISKFWFAFDARSAARRNGLYSLSFHRFHIRLLPTVVSDYDHYFSPILL